MALSYGLSLNNSLVFSIQNQCILANNIISVERLNQYMHITSEAPETVEDNRPPADWPAIGRVEIYDLKVNMLISYFSQLFSLWHELDKSICYKFSITDKVQAGGTTCIMWN